MGGNKRKKETEKEKINCSRNWLLVIVLIVAIIGIIGIAVFACNYSYTLAIKMQYADENANISMLLSTGLSMIGIAIAVWAALNISNAISRGDIENLNNTVGNLNKTVKYIKPYITDNKYIQLELFLVELSRYEKDPIINYLSTLFQKDNVYFSQIPFSELTKIELKFSQVRNRHQSAYEYDPVLIALAKEGLLSIENIKSTQKEKPDCIESYLLYRQCDFLFFMGYCEKSRLAGAKHFAKAAKGYMNISKKIGVQFPKDFSAENFMGNEAVQFRTAYLANTVGEAFSKIVHYYIEAKEEMAEFEKRIITYADKAVNFCTLSVELLDTKQRISVYYRNLGCALERRDSISNNYIGYRETVQAYRTAFGLVIDDYSSSLVLVRNAYYTLLSYYGKIIEYKLTNEGKWKLSNIKDYELECDFDQKELAEYVCDMYYISKIAMEDFGRSLEMLIFHDLSCCFILVLIENSIFIKEELCNLESAFFIETIEKHFIKFKVLSKDKILHKTMGENAKVVSAVVSYYKSKTEKEKHDDE